MLLSFENDLSIAATFQSQIFIMEIYHACPEPGPRFNRGRGDPPTQGARNLSYPSAVIGYPYFIWIPNKACTHMPLLGNVWE